MKSFFFPRYPGKSRIFFLSGVCVIQICTAAIWLLNAETSRAQEQRPVELDPLVRTGTAADWLQSDTIVPAALGGLGSPADAGGSGGVDRALLRTQALSTSVYGGRPGALAQVRGVGLSSDETQVSAFGVPLNPPQGGGFDLSAFPQYLWEGFSWRSGPSIGATDPRGTSGQLALRPWSRSALERAQGKILASTSSQGLAQFAAAGSVTSESGAAAALVAGQSRGLVQGPSASFSALSAPLRALGLPSGQLRFDFLATDLDAENEGTASFPSPLQHSRTRRWIPLVQLETTRLRTTAFADWSDLQTRSPRYSSVTRDQTRQWGNDWAVALTEDRNTRVGASYREVRYASIPFGVQNESIGHVSVVRALLGEERRWILEPQLRISGVSRLGVFPEGAIGASREWMPEGALRGYARLGVARRFASLIDRYYQDPGFVPNPLLKGEWIRYGRVGVESTSERANFRFEVLTQLRSDAQYVRALSGFRSTVEGGATAQIWSALLSGKVDVGSRVRFDGSLVASASRIERSDFGADAYPYVAPWVGTFGAEWDLISHASPQHLGQWSLRWDQRLSSSASGGVGAPRVGPYALTDVRCIYRGGYGSASIAVENLFDRRAELVRTYPLPGRTIVASVEFQAF